jgi:hypothetical protein
MSLLTLIVVLVIVGVALWAINAYFPMDPKIKTLLNVVVMIFLVIWLLQATGVWSNLGTVKIG